MLGSCGLDKTRHYAHIYDTLDNIMSGVQNRYLNNMYTDYYDETFNNLSLEAADLMIELERLIETLGCELPERTRGIPISDSINATGVYWFNSVCMTLQSTDIYTLIEWESGNYRTYPEMYKERRKRLNALKTLTVAQTRLLLPSVCRILVQTSRLSISFESLIGLVRELDYLHSVVKRRDGSVQLHQAAWVE